MRPLPDTLKRKNIRLFLGYGGVWLLLTLWLRLCLPESLMGWERHQLFRFAADYFDFFSNTSYPLLLYAQAFFTQFYVFPLLGAALISGLLVLGMEAWQRLTHRRWTGLIWVWCMLPLLPYFNLVWVLVWLLALGGGIIVRILADKQRGCVARSRWKRTLHYAALGGTGLTAVLLLKENALWVLVFWGTVYGMMQRSLMGTGYGILSIAGGMLIGLALLFAFAYPHYYTPFLKAWDLLKGHLFALCTYPAAFFNLPAFIALFGYGHIVLLVVVVAVALQSDYRHIRRTGLDAAETAGIPTVPVPPKSWWKTTLGAIGVGLLFLSAFGLNLRYQLEDIYLVDRLGGESRWKEAAIAAEYALMTRLPEESIGRKGYEHSRRFIPRPVKTQSIAEEAFLADMLKISLLADRKASSHLFIYNGSIHFPALFPGEILYVPASYLMARYDTDHGLYAEALHILYDFITTNRHSIAVMEPLLWNSVVVGDYAPCRKFIRFFEQSLFHQDIARRYTAYLADTAKTAAIPEIAAARRRLARYNHTVLAYFPDDNMRFRLKYDGDNAAVYEYALCLWMVYKNHPRILQEWDKISRFYTKNLPIHLQEAALANFKLNMLEEAPANIAPPIKVRYMDFCQAVALHQNGYLPLEQLKNKFGNTYWYHLMFNELNPLELRRVKAGVQI